MIATKPEFIKGDQLTVRQYFASLLTGKQPLYTSVWNWWKQSTLYWSIPLGITSLLLYFCLAYQTTWNEAWTTRILLISLSLLPFIVILPMLWLVSYYYAFVLPRHIIQKLEAFINIYFPEAKNVRHIAHNNYVLTLNDLEYEIAYSLMPCKNSKGKTVRYQEGLVICLFYMPDPEKKDELLDEHGQIRQSVHDAWRSYCEGKDSCKALALDMNAIFLLRPFNKLGTRDQIMNSLDQMNYLANRFGLLPLHLDFSITEAIESWLQLIDQPAPDDIIALNIGIFETEDGYCVRLNGSRTYDAADDDWACNNDFIPEEEYFTFPSPNLSDDDWKKVQQLVKEVVEEYITDKVEDKESLFYHKIVTVGFDDGDLIRIR